MHDDFGHLCPSEIGRITAQRDDQSALHKTFSHSKRVNEIEFSVAQCFSDICRLAQASRVTATEETRAGRSVSLGDFCETRENGSIEDSL